MKQLNEYLLGKTKLDRKYFFPTKPDYDKIVDFLENEVGFKKVLYDYDKSDTYQHAVSTIIGIAEKSDNGIFVLANGHDFRDDRGNMTTWIRFCNSGKISESNPIVLIRIERHGTNLGFYRDLGIGYIEYGVRDHISVQTYEDLLNHIHNYFGW